MAYWFVDGTDGSDAKNGDQTVSLYIADDADTTWYYGDDADVTLQVGLGQAASVTEGDVLRVSSIDGNGANYCWMLVSSIATGSHDLISGTVIAKAGTITTSATVSLGADANSGPFKTVATAVAASSTGDTIYIVTGSGLVEYIAGPHSAAASEVFIPSAAAAEILIPGALAAEVYA